MTTIDIFYALGLVLVGGIVSGSFAMPTKHISEWKFENIWLQFAIWTFVILPVVTIFVLFPQILQIYAAAPTNLLVIMMVGGFFLGIGQILFILALNMIGLGLGFVINVGISTSFGFLFPLIFQHADKIMTPFGVVTIIGILLSITGLVISNHAGILRDREKHKLKCCETTNSKYNVGVVLAIISGFFSAGQNFTFSLTYNMQPLAASMGANDLGAANIIWPGFMICCFIPYALYTLYLHHKNQSFVNYRKPGGVKYYILTFIMALCWYLPLIIYSKATQLIGSSLGPLICWPILMIFIILMSSFWGWKHKEWEGCGNKAKKVMKRGLIFLVLAIGVLAYGASL